MNEATVSYIDANTGIQVVINLSSASLGVLMEEIKSVQKQLHKLTQE